MSMACADVRAATLSDAVAITAYGLRMDERPRVLEILGADRRGTPLSERRDGASRVIAWILRKGGGALDEQVWHVPALQIDVEGTVAGIRPHNCAATQVRGLVARYVIGTGARPLDHLFSAHPRDDLGVLIGEKGAHLYLVLMQIRGHAQERPAEAVLVSRIEI